jgi:uncharacterized repeat protein (TIGR03803 family)
MNRKRRCQVISWRSLTTAARVPGHSIGAFSVRVDGITQRGGAKNAGTVFSITASGTESVLHSFTGHRADGTEPDAPLLNVNGTLYGTTQYGGAIDRGTVFSIARSGTEAVLHSFGGSGDGKFPHAGFMNSNGTLYGTTERGGSSTVPLHGHRCRYELTALVDLMFLNSASPVVAEPGSVISPALARGPR